MERSDRQMWVINEWRELWEMGQVATADLTHRVVGIPTAWGGAAGIW